MKKDYLWDGSGEPDPEIQKLESLLGTFRFSRPAPAFHEVLTVQPRPGWFERFRQRFYARPAYAAQALAFLALLIVAGWWFMNRGPAYEVINLNGAPRVGSRTIVQSGRLAVGQWLETDGTSRARIQVGDVGEVEIEPNTRIGVMRARTTEHRLSLHRGTIHALILAPPRRFFVNTPSAQAIDLGCAYTLEVGDDGSGLLRVTSGWVAFEHNGIESFVPAGAICMTRPGTGPGTPHRADVSAAFRTALERLDFEPAATTEARDTSLALVLLEARKEDAVTLWHLLTRRKEVERSRVYMRLAELVPPPPGVTPEGILKRDRRMLDRWWNELGMGGTGWWRQWERPWPDSK